MYDDAGGTALGGEQDERLATAEVLAEANTDFAVAVASLADDDLNRADGEIVDAESEDPEVAAVADSYVACAFIISASILSMRMNRPFPSESWSGRLASSQVVDFARVSSDSSIGV